MENKDKSSPEEWAAGVLGDVMFRGNFDIVQKIWQVFIKVNASTVLVYFRHRTGTAFINSFTLFWGYAMLFILGAIEGLTRIDYHMVMGQDLPSESSFPLFWMGIIAFLVIGIRRIREANKNLRRMDGKGVPRYSGDTGLSYLWPRFERLIVEPFGIAKKGGDEYRWWQMDEYRFQKWVEPALIFLLGAVLIEIGYFAFGWYLLTGSFCSLMMVMQLEDNYFRIKQETWDAEVLSSVVRHKDEPVERKEGSIVHQNFIRTDRNFEQWRTANSTASRFASSQVA